MKDRVAGKSPRGTFSPGPPTGRLAAPVTEKIILGIDPSLRGTGYGVIRTGRPHFLVLAQGTIACPRDWERSRSPMRRIIRVTNWNCGKKYELR